MSTSLTETDLRDPSLVTECPSAEDTTPPFISVKIRQDSLAVTLDGPSLFIFAVSLITAIHILPPAVLAVLIGLITVVLFVQNDYQNFLNLGPGGVPSTLVGYVRITWLKIWALRDPLVPLCSDQSTTQQPAAGILQGKKLLPYRLGPRPRVAGIVPHRQIDQSGSTECYLALRRIIEAHALAHADEAGAGTSCYEKHGLGLFARHPVNNTCQGEICHVHSSDYSLHLNLHPDDAREVLEKGWGERHPLAHRGYLFRMPVPCQFTLIYAPRTRDELKVVCQIIEAAGWWVAAKEISIDLLGEA